jgi:hypothetical protein
MRERLITLTLFLAAVMLGYVIRGPVNGRQMAYWINGSCEIKQRMVPVPEESRRKGQTDIYIQCE